MVLFHFTLPKKEICTEPELYFRAWPEYPGDVEYLEESGQICMRKNARVSFDTYFNCFSYSRYQKYTNVTMLEVSLQLKGAFRIRLFARRKGGIPALLSERGISHDTVCAAQVAQPLAELAGEGFLYAELLALSDEAVFYGGWYECADAAVRPVKLAVAVCSYRHEKYVYHNAAMLGRYLSLPQNRGFHDHISMLIIDNGQTLEQEKLECDRAVLFYNRNLGGSGGFTRGLIEAARSAEGFTHVCLMDDDVRFDPEVLYKTFSFLRLVREDWANISVGGTMLELEQPYNQYEMGGLWTGKTIVNVRSGFDVRLVSEVLANEGDQPVDYNAWWYMCMPVSVVEKYGLPMPFFIKGDDMDYGLRATEGIVLMNGIAVWHEGFAGKYNGALEYYIKRNELVLNALHRPEYGMFRNLMKLLFSCGKQIVFQRYNVVDFIIRAYEDFLKGVDFFLETDGERLNRELLGQNIPMLDDEALAGKLEVDYPGICFQPKPPKRPHRILRVATLYSYLIPRSLYDKTQSYRLIELTDSFPVDFYKSECVIQYSSDSHKGFITTLHKSEAVRFGFRFIKISLQMLFGFRRAVKSYQKRWPELTGEAFWFGQLQLDPANSQSKGTGQQSL